MTHFRVVGEEDDEIDAIAARDAEPARAAQGYTDTLAPRRRAKPGPTHWAIVERDGDAPAAPTVAGKTCRYCPEPALVLVHDPKSPDNPVRVCCPKCAGQRRADMTYGDRR